MSTTSKAEKERLKLIQDKCQHYLMELLKDDDNKYCVDCDAKGPRWASWNLGVFLCIRCAGIHRNLGVHISKVKSVNLDAWTPEQVGYLQQMGNSQARAVYEANLPDNFRRPQTDSSLEAFIRSKYEHRKYIAKEWVQPPTPPPAFDVEEERKKEKEKKKQKATALIRSSLSSSDIQTNPVPRPHSNPAGNTISADKVPKDKQPSLGKISNGENDLLGLSFDTSPTAASLKSPSPDEDPFDVFVSAPTGPTEPLGLTPSNVASFTLGDEESDFFNQKVPEKKMDKDSILKMFDSNSIPVNPLLTSSTINSTGLFPNNNPNILPFQATSLVSTTTTNPFLPSSGSQMKQPTSAFQVHQQFGALNMNSVVTNSWSNPIPSIPPTDLSLPSKAISSLDSINPFATSGPNISLTGQGNSTKSTNIFADLTQLTSLNEVSKTSTQVGAGLNWTLTPTVSAASTSVPSTDMWQ